MPAIFEKAARVMVPGQEAEGVVMDVTEALPGFPVYTLRWLTVSGEPQTATCGEGDLRGANPTEADHKAEAEAARIEIERQARAVESEVRRLVKIEMDDFRARQRQLAKRRKLKNLKRKKR